MNHGPTRDTQVQTIMSVHASEKFVCSHIMHLQNGVLVLLAVEDRQMYISTGKGTMQYLSTKTLHAIIAQSKPFLREQK